MNVHQSFRMLVATAVFAMAGIAHADVKPSDIASAVQAHNLPRAESLAQQATQEHPSSAKAWYLLAEVEERMHKSNEGLSALQRAKQIDPSLKFAKDPSFVAQLQSNLNGQHAAPVAPSRSSSNLYSSAPTRSATTAPSTYVAPTAAPVSHGHFPWGIVILILVLIGGGIGAFMFMKGRKEAAQKDAARQDAQRIMGDAQTEAMALQQTIKFEGKSSSQLGNDVADILNTINTEMTHLKSTSGDAWVGRDSVRNQAVRALNDAKGRQRSGMYDTIAPAPRTATERIADADADRQAQARRDQQLIDDRIRAQQAQANQGGYNPGYQGGGYPAQQPVIINNGNNNSSDGLLTGVLLGEAMGGGFGRERVVERDVYVDRDSGRNRDYERAAPAPAAAPDDSDSGLFDTGSGSDNSWNDNSSSNDSVDSGSGSGSGSSDDDNFDS